MRIQVYQAEEDGVFGLGVKVLSKEATLADLLAAWQPLCDAEDISRTYGNSPTSPCKGCMINCCNTAYVIPDIIAFKKIAKHLDISHIDFISNYFQPDKVEHGLLRFKPEPCIFLKDNICSIYPVRTLICRFYLCTPLLPATEQLIYDITWTGIAATQLFGLATGLIKPLAQQGLTSFDQLFINLLDEYRHNPRTTLFMEAKEYGDILLDPFI